MSLGIGGRFDSFMSNFMSTTWSFSYWCFARERALAARRTTCSSSILAQVEDLAKNPEGKASRISFFVVIIIIIHFLEYHLNLLHHVAEVFG